MFTSIFNLAADLDNQRQVVSALAASIQPSQGTNQTSASNVTESATVRGVNILPGFPAMGNQFAGAPTQGFSTAVKLTEAVHAVPPYLVELAASGSYVDLIWLHPKNLPTLPSTKTSDADLEKVRKDLMPIKTYEAWLEAFVAYSSLISFYHPQKVLF